jgi:hypothetical protein
MGGAVVSDDGAGCLYGDARKLNQRSEVWLQRSRSRKAENPGATFRHRGAQRPKILLAA